MNIILLYKSIKIYLIVFEKYGILEVGVHEFTDPPCKSNQFLDYLCAVDTLQQHTSIFIYFLVKTFKNIKKKIKNNY